MKIAVNLATRPFVELRPFFLRLRLAMAALVLLCFALGIAAHLLRRRVDAQQAQLNAVETQTARVQAERHDNEVRMRQPGNAAVLARAHFLNALFLRKSFSWTAVMMDLETVLPTGVQVTSIEPQVSADGTVAIRLRVAGERGRAVQLVRNLEHSRRFLEPRITTEVAQAKEGQGTAVQGTGPIGPGLAGFSRAAIGGPPPGVEFEVFADYNPLPASAAYAPGREVHAQPTGAAVAPAGAARQTSAGRRVQDGIVLKPYSTTAIGGAAARQAGGPGAAPATLPAAAREKP